jgi:hypothetical protein
MKEANSPPEAHLAAMREALSAALQSHVNLGKARPCSCSLCSQIRAALQPGAGASFSDYVREECAQVADWKIAQLQGELSLHPDEGLKLALKSAREIADRIRVLKGRTL